MSLRLVSRSVAWLSLLLSLGMQGSAQAKDVRWMFFELGGGLSTMTHASTFFGSGASASMGLGTSLQSTLAIYVRHPSSDVRIALGAQGRISTVSSNSRSFGVVGAYGILRVEWAGFYAGFGAAPLVWKRNSGQTGYQNFSSSSGSLGLLGEFGYYYEITPAVGFLGTAALEAVSTSGVLSPNPIMQGLIGIRFNFGMAGAPSSDNDEYKGWRYPYGREMRY